MKNDTTRKKDTNMKTNQIPAMFRSSCLAFATIAVLALASAANAQYKPVGADGIAASPKVRQLLNKRKASATTATVAAPAMACPKCADVQATEVNRQAKGAEILAGAATKVVVKHNYTGCEVNWTVVGEGKAKHSVATHKCTADVPNNLACCASN